MILNGTFTVYRGGRLDGYYALFYRGTDSKDMYYFATGPYNMKDIRLVELPDHRIGVFSRPRNDEIIRLYGSESQIGFTVIDDLNELTEETISNADYIPGLFATSGSQEVEIESLLVAPKYETKGDFENHWIFSREGWTERNLSPQERCRDRFIP